MSFFFQIIALHISDLLVFLDIVSLFVCLFYMCFSLVMLRLWSDFQLALHFEVRRLFVANCFYT